MSNTAPERESRTLAVGDKSSNYGIDDGIQWRLAVKPVVNLLAQNGFLDEAEDLRVPRHATIQELFLQVRCVEGLQGIDLRRLAPENQKELRDAIRTVRKLANKQHLRLQKEKKKGQAAARRLDSADLTEPGEEIPGGEVAANRINSVTEKSREKSNRFEEILTWARRNLRGRQLLLIERLCGSNGEYLKQDFVQEEAVSQWKKDRAYRNLGSLVQNLNRNIAHHGVRVVLKKNVIRLDDIANKSEFQNAL